MSLLTDVKRRAAAMFGRAREERETGDEVQFHLEMLTQRFERGGASPVEARRRALVAFGGSVQTQEGVREARGTLWLEDLGRDIRFAFRQLRAHPAFTLVVTITLALGIGATTAMFSAVDHVLMRPAPFARPHELAMVWGTDSTSGTTREPVSWPDLVDFRRRSRSFAEIAGVIGTQVNLAARGAEPSRATAVTATGNIFALLGVRAVTGRLFTDADDQPGGPPIAVIAEALWRARFNGDPAAIGSTVRIDEVTTEIVGVVPTNADFGIDQMNARAAYHEPYSPEGSVDVWMPLRATEEQLPRSTHPILALGRLQAGTTVVAGQRELTTIAADLERSYPENAARGVHIEALDEAIFAESRPLLRLLLAAVALLLIVATVNVANLLLARATSRVREVALRGAIGASSGRLTRQFSAESLVLVAMGTLAGVGIAAAALRMLRRLGPADVPRLTDTVIDGRALLVTLGIAVVVGTVFGLVPVLTAFRSDSMPVLKGEGANTGMSRGGVRLRDGLVVAQLALCVALAIGASLVARSFAAVTQVDPGFNSTGIVKAEYGLPGSRYPRDFARFPNFVEITRFNDRLLENVRRLPGVIAAASAAAHPLDAGFTNSWRVVGREAEGRGWPEISVRIISPGYVETMGLRLITGRGFGLGDDGSGAPVAMINETAAQRFFAGVDAVGQQISFWGSNRLIVGVLRDERIHGLTAPAPPATYVPFSQAPPSTGVLLVRGSGDPATLGAALRRAIAELDPQLAVYHVEPFVATLSATLAQRRFAMLVLGAFAVVTMILAIVGVHGVVSYAAAQRTREIGIRQALGATRGETIGMVLRGAVLLATAGIVLGLAGGAVGSGLLASLLFGVSRFDLATYIGVPVAIAGIALLSAYLPARRAASCAPLAAIRAS